MNELPDIGWLRLLAAFGLLLIPVALSLKYRLGILRQLFISAGRMTGQLFLMSIILVFLFQWDNTWLNVAWVVLMIFFACLSAMINSKLSFGRLFLPVFVAYFLATFVVLLFFNAVIVNPDNIFTARLMVVVGGMLLGNSLNSTIIGISHFYGSIQKENKRYLYLLGLGASQREALLPFFREAFLLSMKPFMASMATMGLVSIPGMMTGQILGGADPQTAIKYQIAIVLAIFTAISISVTLSVYFTSRKAFDPYGMLRKDFFSD